MLCPGYPANHLFSRDDPRSFGLNVGHGVWRRGEEGVGIDVVVEGRLVEAVQYKTRSRMRGYTIPEGGSARSSHSCYISFVHICSRRSRVSGSGRVYRAVDTCILGIVNELKEVV